MWSEWLNTALRITAWALAGGGTLLLLWALLWDRARGRQRCPCCWYSMQSVPAKDDGTRICPECGREWAQKQLLRTRRRWRWLGASFAVFAIAYAVAVTPDVRQVGWIGAAPTSGLIWWVGRFPPPERLRKGARPPVADELVRRIEANRLHHWQMRWLLHEVRFVRTHARWPRGRPLEISFGVPEWLQPTLWRDFEAQSPLPGATRAYLTHSRPWTAGELPPDATSFSFSVRTRYWSGAWRIPITQVASVDEAMEAAADPDVEAAIHRYLRVGIRSGDANLDRTHLLDARLARPKAPELDDIAVGFRVELMRDGETVQSWDLIMHDTSSGDGTDWVLFNPPKLMWNENDPAEMARWTLRVRGSADIALRDLGRNRYWRGEMEGLLAEFLR